jgi:penicillin-insensitive murein endopeptidase
LRPHAIDRYNAAVLVPRLTATAITTVVMTASLAGTARGNDGHTAKPRAAHDGAGPGANEAANETANEVSPETAPETAIDVADLVTGEAAEPMFESALPDTETVEAPAPSLDALGRDAWQGSVSCGSANRGALYGAVLLPRAGVGYSTPEPWWSRGRRYGTTELVGLIMRSAAAVEQQHPGGLLGVADLSAENGGVLPGHRSHQSGRDADLVFYALDPRGQPFAPDQHMAYYTHSGLGQHARAPSFAPEISERYFDLARNWALVRALLTDAESEVEHIFVSARVRRWLLDYARQLGEPEELQLRAARVLRKPRGVDGHNDHMHVRVRCSADDEALGRCRNEIVNRPRRARRWRSYVACPAPFISSLPDS